MSDERCHAGRNSRLAWLIAWTVIAAASVGAVWIVYGDWVDHSRFLVWDGFWLGILASNLARRWRRGR